MLSSLLTLGLQHSLAKRVIFEYADESLGGVVNAVGGTRLCLDAALRQPAKYVSQPDLCTVQSELNQRFITYHCFIFFWCPFVCLGPKVGLESSRRKGDGVYRRASLFVQAKSSMFCGTENTTAPLVDSPNASPTAEAP